MSSRVDLARRALDWIERSLAELASPAGPDSAAESAWIKSLGELALTGDLIAGSAGLGELEQRARDLIAWAWSSLDEGRILERLLARANQRLALITVYPPFYRHGMVNRSLEELAISIGDLGNRQVALPLAALMRTLGRPGKPLLEAAGSRWLLQMQPGWMLGTQLGYSMTHTVFYLTDFGRHADGLTDELLDYLLVWTPVWTEHYRRAGNLDLLGELVMVSSILGLETPPRVWETIASAQREDGMIPATTREPPPDVTTLVERNRHATLVGIMAAAMDSAGG